MACQARSDMALDACCDAVFQIASTPIAVRDALREILDHPVLAQLPEDARGTAELVLAEALNNIVEHAYDRDDGPIGLRLQRQPTRLICDVFDAGAPMPNSELPKGLAQPVGPNQDLPEGGYGWFLIRALTENLVYRRIAARNHLSFQLNIEQ